tara:strand:+ start:1022 stop:1201 length:180 start_codon:yes stop_codon:yes gene_type:complete
MAKTKKKDAPKKKATPKVKEVKESKTIEIVATNTIQYVPHKPRKIDRVPPPKEKIWENG